jgi:hypothetical protein
MYHRCSKPKIGKVKTLTNGHGTMSIRQWQQYPQILPPELFSDEQLTSSDMRFQTLQIPKKFFNIFQALCIMMTFNYSCYQLTLTIFSLEVAYATNL